MTLTFRAPALLVLCLALSLTNSAGLAQTKWDLPSGYGANTFQVQNLMIPFLATSYAEAKKLDSVSRALLVKTLANFLTSSVSGLIANSMRTSRISMT